MFVRQQENEESIRLICGVLDHLALTYFGSKLDPGVICMDHCEAFRSGSLSVWPNVGTYHVRIEPFHCVSALYQCVSAL